MTPGSLALMVLVVMMFLKVWRKRVTQLIGKGGVCRTAPDTQGLVVTVNSGRRVGAFNNIKINSYRADSF